MLVRKLGAHIHKAAAVPARGLIFQIATCAAQIEPVLIFLVTDERSGMRVQVVLQNTFYRLRSDTHGCAAALAARLCYHQPISSTTTDLAGSFIVRLPFLILAPLNATGASTAGLSNVLCVFISPDVSMRPFTWPISIP